MEYMQYAVKRSVHILRKGRDFFGVSKTERNPHRFVAKLEELRRPSGAFIAAPALEYEALWVRDQLYCTLSYFYTGDMEKFKEGIWVVFDIFRKHQEKIENVICNLPHEGYKHIHAKFDSYSLDEITDDWGHHQLDAIGLFLYLVAFSYSKGVNTIRGEKDTRVLQLLVSYLTAVRYFEFPDHGMWEEELDLHASSIGAVVAGLTLLEEQKLAVVPYSLILRGQKVLYWLLPNESPDRDVDMAALSLIWPYNIATPEIREIILERVKNKLVRKHGLNRYLGDNYYCSDNGMSGEWPIGFFWLSIIASKKGDNSEAKHWFDRGMKSVTPEGYIPELYQNGCPNGHTPLAWSHAMAIIAEKKLK